MNLYPEIEVIKAGVTKRYRLIYGPVDSQEGYFAYWPKKEDGGEYKKSDWLKAYTTNNLSVKLYLIGSIYRHRDEEDMIGSEMKMTVNSNEEIFLRLLSKYFDDYDNGLLIKQDTIFIDLLYGPYSSDQYVRQIEIPSKTEEEEEYNYNYLRLYADGTLMKILDTNYTWDDLYNATFISSEYFDELVEDLKSFEQLLF